MNEPKSGFLKQQLQFQRVREAQRNQQSKIEITLSKNNLTIDNFHLLIIGFKDSDELEIYCKPKKNIQYRKVLSRAIYKKSGIPGPKREQGDKQVPEGFYYIDRFNPKSKFHLSLGLNYPNQSDKIKSNFSDPGGDIFIHGGCQTTGCIPITDAIMEEIYLFAVHARNNGQEQIPVYIFPFKMTEKNLEKFSGKNKDDTALIAFWKNLKIGYEHFQKDKIALDITISGIGDYIFER